MEKATFAAGCFWGVEETFRQFPGVLDTAVGFMGGTTADPSYREVCGGRTGHAEVVHLEYDPTRISYDDLLEAFWSCHDPTTLTRPGDGHRARVDILASRGVPPALPGEARRGRVPGAWELTGEEEKEARWTSATPRYAARTTSG